MLQELLVGRRLHELEGVISFPLAGDVLVRHFVVVELLAVLRESLLDVLDLELHRLFAHSEALVLAEAFFSACFLPLQSHPIFYFN